jgi:rhodanese-related sulfurtransferase
MKQILIIMSIFSTLFGPRTPQDSAIKLLTSEAFRTQVQVKNVQLVDVRTPLEYKNGHLKNAINIDFFSEKFDSEFNKLNKEKAIYLYCRSGNRSRKAANKLATMGFIEIYDLEGGILKY